MCIKKKIIFLIMFLLACETSYAYRMPRPIKFTDLKDPAQINALNETLSQLWNITNGRYTPEITTSIPTTAGQEGDMKLYHSGSTYRLYYYTDGAWRYATLN